MRYAGKRGILALLMLSFTTLVFAISTGLLLAVIAIIQVLAGEFLRKVFNDTGRRSEGRRLRRSFEWCLHSGLGCGGYIASLQQVREFAALYAPDVITSLFAAQLGLGFIALGFFAAAFYRLHRAVSCW